MLQIEIPDHVSRVEENTLCNSYLNFINRKQNILCKFYFKNKCIFKFVNDLRGDFKIILNNTFSLIFRFFAQINNKKLIFF